MKKLFPLYLIIFTGYIGISMIVILFTTMIMQDAESILSSDYSFNDRSYLLGAIVSMYPLGQFIGLPMIGSLSDHYGRKKILCISLALCALFYMFVGLGIQFLNFPIILMSLFLLGFCEGNVVIAQSIISEQTTEKKERLRRFGMISILISLSFITGPFLVAHLGLFDLPSPWNFSIPFFLLGILIIIFFCLLVLFSKYPKAQKKETSYSPKFALIGLLKHRQLIYIYIANFFLYLAFAGVLRLYPIFLVEKFELNTIQLSRAIAMNGIGIILANLLVAPKLRNFSTVKILRIIPFLVCISVLMITFQTKIYLAVMMTLFSCMLLGTCSIFALEQISKIAPQENLGEILGNNSSLNTLSQVLIGFIGSYVITLNINGSIWISSIFALLAAIIYIKISRRS